VTPAKNFRKPHFVRLFYLVKKAALARWVAEIVRPEFAMAVPA